MGFISKARKAKNTFCHQIIKWQDVKKLPKCVLIVLANPRSGSTWFSDALRAHPKVEYWPSAVILEQLRIKMRRYPIDLAGKCDGKLKIETFPGLWEKIPLFDITNKIDQPITELSSHSYAIEKIHPEGFVFKFSEFLKNVKKLESKDVEIKLIYQVRDPEASLVSFMNYQKRNPQWYPGMKGRELVIYMFKTYQVLYKIAKKRKGYIVDYSELVEDLESVLNKIYAYVWPDSYTNEPELVRSISHAAVKATARDKREKKVTPFLGTVVGSVKGSDGQHYDFFNKYKTELEECYKVYSALLNLK